MGNCGDCGVLKFLVSIVTCEAGLFGLPVCLSRKNTTDINSGFRSILSFVSVYGFELQQVRYPIFLTIYYGINYIEEGCLHHS